MPERVVVMFVFDGVQPIDVSGPAQALVTANEAGATPPYVLRVCALGPGPVMTHAGFALAAEALPEGAIHTLLIPGGPGVWRHLSAGDACLAVLRRLCGRAERVCAICTGAMLLAATGLLDGRRAVTHWAAAGELAYRFPRVAVAADGLFVQDGRFWTSAGVTAGIDLTLALIEADHGASLAVAVARRLVVYLRRDGGQAQYSEPLAAQTRAAGPYAELVARIAAAPALPWGIDEMAAVAGQSLRSFHRQFKTHMGETPARLVERIRADYARHYLHSTGLALKQVALRAGFPSEAALGRAIRRCYGVSPGALRARFSGGGG